MNKIMQQVLMACVPMLLVITYFNLYWCGIVLLTGLSAQITDTLWTHFKFKHQLSLKNLFNIDDSALVTGILLGLCLPPNLPIWLPVIGGFISVVLGKQLYGGLGSNPFNPAMVAYLMLLLGFPMEMTDWSGLAPDAITQATLLDRANTLAIEDWYTTRVFLIKGSFAIAALLGGIWLLKKKIIRLVIPASVLLGFWGTDILLSDYTIWHRILASSYDLILTAAIFGAFFIATDPVTAPIHPSMHKYYGLGIGILSALIHSGERYPDGFAFAVILMNILGPSLDAWANRRLSTT